MITETPTDRRRFWVTYGVAMAVAAIAYLSVVPMPFLGDQALFVVIAEALDGGAVLYRDIWDLKQPGIYVFYLVGGNLFGFSEIGIHTLDLILALAFVATLALALRREVHRGWIAAVSPAVLLGVYAAVADSSEITQVENVVGPFVFAVAWLALDPFGWGRAAAFASGLAAGIVLVFKFFYLPLVALLWLTVLVFRRRDGVGWGPIVGSFLVPAALGAAIPLLALLAYIVANDLVEIARFTYFEYPPQEAALAPRPFSRLIRSIGGYFVPLAAFVAFAAYRIGRGDRRRGWRLSVLMAVWLLTSLVLYFFQPWWSYYLYLGFVPLAVLALQGLDDALDRWSARVVGVAALVLLLPALALGAIRVGEWVPPLIAGDPLVEIQGSIADAYGRALDDLEAVAPIDGERVYVVGNPVILYRGDAIQAIPVNGWSPEYWTDELWDRVTDDLAADPPPYLFVSTENVVYVGDRGPQFAELLDTAFEPSIETESGTWYVPLGP